MKTPNTDKTSKEKSTKFNVMRRCFFGFPLRFLLALSLILALLLVLGNNYISDMEKEQKRVIEQQLSIKADKIEDVIKSRLFMLDVLESHVQDSPNINQSSFQVLAQTILKQDPSVRSLQLARNNIISHIYPLTSNESVFGHDLFNDVKTNANVLLAYQTLAPTIYGPATLRQGNKGLIVRQPIRIKNETDQNITDWGLSILVLDWDEFLQETDLISLGNEQDIALRKRLNNTYQPAFWGNEQLFNDTENTLVTVDVKLPNGLWQLAKKVDNKQLTLLKYTVLVVSIIVVLLICFLRQVVQQLTWAGPAALAGAFILLGAVIIGLSYYSANNANRAKLLDKTEIIRTDIRNRLKGSLDYILLLNLARVSNSLTSEEFQFKASTYVNAHPELINITWIDAQFVIRDAAPLKGNEQIIGLKVDLKEPYRASRLAKELRFPVYTHPFLSIQGPAAFEVWVPVFRGNVFLGLFAGVYSVPNLFKIALSNENLELFGISMVTHDGQVIDASLVNSSKEIEFSKTIALSPPGHNIALRIDRYKDPIWRWDLIILALLALSLAIGVFWGMFVLIRARTVMKEQLGQLQHVANYDLLTNLPNRVLLSDRLSHAMIQCRRNKQSLAVVFLDLDGFKAVNDAYGHNIGDELLIALSIRMKEALREGDTLSRIGGDEFVIVLTELATVEDCEPVLDRLLLAAAKPVKMANEVLNVSASIGVTFYPQDNMDADLLMRHADQAMYVAKQSGKNRYHLFDTAQDDAVKVQREGLEAIRSALDNHQFVLHYQPKVNMKTGVVIGFEALIRWQHPERGLLNPISFLPVIENTPMMIEMGEWVIDTALIQISQWQRMGDNFPVNISVNIAAAQLQQINFVDKLTTLLAAHPDVKPCHLELEVLETSALDDVHHISTIMKACIALGINFALDDFGTGYSSLTYLRRLPASLIKIDQTFVRDMLNDVDDLAIVEGVIALAKSFKRDVIAEGVETIEHGSALLQLGCESAQGYGIARPMPASDIPAWVNEWKPDISWQN